MKLLQVTLFLGLLGLLTTTWSREVDTVFAQLSPPVSVKSEVCGVVPPSNAKNIAFNITQETNEDESIKAGTIKLCLHNVNTNLNEAPVLVDVELLASEGFSFETSPNFEVSENKNLIILKPIRIYPGETKEIKFKLINNLNRAGVYRLYPIVRVEQQTIRAFTDQNTKLITVRETELDAFDKQQGIIANATKDLQVSLIRQIVKDTDKGALKIRVQSPSDGDYVLRLQTFGAIQVLVGTTVGKFDLEIPFNRLGSKEVRFVTAFVVKSPTINFPGRYTVRLTWKSKSSENIPSIDIPISVGKNVYDAPLLPTETPRMGDNNAEKLLFVATKSDPSNLTNRVKTINLLIWIENTSSVDIVRTFDISASDPSKVFLYKNSQQELSPTYQQTIQLGPHEGVFLEARFTISEQPAPGQYKILTSIKDKGTIIVTSPLLLEMNK